MTLPLAIIQARMGSRRLPGKVLLPLGGASLLERAWVIACSAFGKEHVVVAHPDTAENQPIAAACDAMGAQRFAYRGDENDVLGRFWTCAHTYRWTPESVIVRVTPDDPFKTVAGLKRVADGERLPVEIGGEAFTLGELDYWQENTDEHDADREHITRLLFPVPPPPPPSQGVWTIDTESDYRAACELVEHQRKSKAIARDEGLMDKGTLIATRRNRGKESIPSDS